MLCTMWFMLLLLACVTSEIHGKSVASRVLYFGVPQQNRSNQLILDDLKFSPRQKKAMKNRMFFKSAFKWANGIVPYTIDSVIAKDPVRLNAIQTAIEVYHTRTCTKWVERTTETFYVNFMDGGYQRCYAYYGMSMPGQPISIGDQCGYVGVVLHEMMHTLGFVHEHQRPDRDNYIKIMPENIITDYLYAFDKQRPDLVELQNFNYDYNSIMHYFGTAFSKDGSSTTIFTKDRSVQYTIGTANSFSECDLEKINNMYECKAQLTNNPICKVETVPKKVECIDSVNCPLSFLSINGNPKSVCNENPGFYMVQCKAYCDNCDEKRCFDTTNSDLSKKYCKNETITCDNVFKRNMCPKLCGLCSTK